MKKYFDKKNIITLIISAIVFTSLGVIAGSLSADEISFTPSNENWNVKTVGEAMNYLYSKNDDSSIKPELLWTNENPTSNFEAQTVPLDLSEYKYVIVVDRHNTNKNSLPHSSAIVPVGNYENYIMIGNTHSIVEKTVRGIKATTTGVAFTNAYWGNDPLYKNYNIPIYIYGVKGDLGINIFE